MTVAALPMLLPAASGAGSITSASAATPIDSPELISTVADSEAIESFDEELLNLIAGVPAFADNNDVLPAVHGEQSLNSSRLDAGHLAVALPVDQSETVPIQMPSHPVESAVAPDATVEVNPHLVDTQPSTNVSPVVEADNVAGDPIVAQQQQKPLTVSDGADKTITDVETEATPLKSHPAGSGEAQSESSQHQQQREPRSAVNALGFSQETVPNQTVPATRRSPLPPAIDETVEAHPAAESQTAGLVAELSAIDATILAPSQIDIGLAAGSTSIDPPADIAQQIANEAVRHAELVKHQGQQRFTMRLDPPELGELEVEMERTVDGISLRVHAVEATTMSMIQDSLDTLNRDLNQQESVFQEMNIDVSTGKHSGSGHTDSKSPNQHANLLPVAEEANPTEDQPATQVSFVA